MSKADAGDKRSYVPRSMASLVPQIARPVFQKRSPASAQLLSDWADIVGPELGAVTYAKRFSAGTLTIACTGVVALELQHRADLLRGRINGALGRLLVDRIKFVQEAPRVALPPPVKPAVKQRVTLATHGIPEGPLRDALEALGAAVLSEPAKR